MPHIDLLELPYFTGIAIDTVVSLIDAMVPANFEPGQAILTQGDKRIPPLYIVTRGKVSITKHTLGEDGYKIAELNAPTVLGEVELFCQIPAVATARAETRVHAFALTPTTFDALFTAGHPGLLRFVLNLAKVACHRLATTDTLLSQLMTHEQVALVHQKILEQEYPGSTGHT